MIRRVAVIARWLNPVLTECIALMRERGVEVTPIFPGEQLTNIDEVRVEHDLYLMKAGTAAAHSLAAVLWSLGGRFLNPYPVVLQLRDKFQVNYALRQAGVRVPDTYMTCDREHVVELLKGGPVVVKPPTGSRGRGVAVIREAADLDGVELEKPTLVQRYHTPDRQDIDHKVFRIGDRMFGINRRWPIRTYDDKQGTPFEVSPKLAAQTKAVGDAFGLELYGVDFVVSDGVPYAVDVNKFGSYVGVPDGPRLLADFFLEGRGSATRDEL